jgi:transposase
LVALLLYAYSRNERSSRVIDRECLEDIAYRVIAMNERPDDSTIARFVARHERALAGVFGSVLKVCARAGLVNLAVIAVDGAVLAPSPVGRGKRCPAYNANPGNGRGGRAAVGAGS